MTHLESPGRGRDGIAQNRVDLGQDLRSQLLDDLESGNVLVDLLGTRGTDDSGRNVLVGQDPGKGQLGQSNVVTKLGSNGAQRLDLGKLLLPGLVAKRLAVADGELVTGLSQTAAGRGLVDTVVLATQDTLLEGRPDGQAQAVLLVQVAELILDLAADEQVVLRLLNNGADQAELVSGAPGIGDLGGSPLRGTPVEDLALV